MQNGDPLELQVLYSKIGRDRALLIVSTADTKNGLESLLRQSRIRRWQD